MGNMLPSLFQTRSNTLLPPMNAQHWSRSMKVLARNLRRIMRRPCRVSRAQLAASREVLAVHHHATSRAIRTHQKNGHQSRRRVVRVKVVLTRAEAARLVSLTEHGDRTAAQIVREFNRMQVTGGNASPAAAAMKAWRPVLASIPEELP